MIKKITSILSQEYSNNVLTDFRLKTEKIYEILGEDFILNEKEIRDDKQRCFTFKTWINEDYQRSIVSNISFITFKSPLPKIIAKEVKTNLENFNKVFSTIIGLYENEINNENRIVLENYINSVFGCIKNVNSDIYSNHTIKAFTAYNSFLGKILVEFRGHILHLNGPGIYFRNFDEIKERFYKVMENINRFNLITEISNSKFGFFDSKLKYFVEENNKLKIKGLYHFGKDGAVRGSYLNL